MFQIIQHSVNLKSKIAAIPFELAPLFETGYFGDLKATDLMSLRFCICDWTFSVWKENTSQVLNE